MLIACKCLNVMLGPAKADDDAAAGAAATTTTINSRPPAVFQPEHVLERNGDSVSEPDEQMSFVSRSALERLTADQANFFKSLKVSSISAITPVIQQPNLVNVVPVENWMVHTCRHCKSIVYARAIDSTKLLINPQFSTSQEKIDAIRMQKNFSKSFNILTMCASKPSNGDAEALNSRKLESKQLRKCVNDVIQSETEATEERIDRYAKQQMALLALFREKAEQDYQDILRTIYDDATNKNAGDAMTMNDINDITLTTTPNAKLLSDLTPPVTPDNTPMSIGNSPTFKTQTQFSLVHQDVNKTKQANRLVQSTPDKHLQRSNGRSDEELFFDMDGMDETELRISSHEMTSSDDEDDVDNDDSHCEDFYDGSQSRAIKISPANRRNGPNIAIAQSLPIAVPIFNQRIDDDDYEEYAERQDNLDIAASIKALAKSVHGETIFGDLPKPRFSTQI